MVAPIRRYGTVVMSGGDGTSPRTISSVPSGLYIVQVTIRDSTTNDVPVELSQDGTALVTIRTMGTGNGLTMPEWFYVTELGGDHEWTVDTSVDLKVLIIKVK